MADDKILNKQQEDAIYHGEGPLLVIAGAGTGKTTVITKRIQHLILEKHIDPTHILALTFTEKAAKEMEERVDVALPYGYSQLWIATFHSFCDRILRDEAIHIGLNPGYTLASDTELVLFLRKHLFSFALDYFRPLGNPTKFLTSLLQHFSRLKDEDITPEEYLAYAQTLTDTEELEIKKTLELANAYDTYEALKVKEGIMDFSDLISNTLLLFRKRPNMLRTYQEKFQYILVDEFQDTNYAQNMLTILLAGDKKNITVVGDDDQAIYRWRGAALSNIIQFRKQFPDTKIVTLTKNYRSTKEILDRSYDLIQHNNPDRLEVKENINKKLLPTRTDAGEEVGLSITDRVENEAVFIVQKIRELIQKGYTYSDIAILVRANDHSQPFVQELVQQKIPYQFLGPEHLFKQEEVKDLIAYLRVLYDYRDSACLYRVLSMPLFKLEGRDIAYLLSNAKRDNLYLFEAMEQLVDETQTTFLTDEVKEKVKKILTMIKGHLTHAATDTAGQLLYDFIKTTGLLQKMVEPTTDIDEKKYQNIARFFDKMKSYEATHDDASVFAIVDWIDLATQMGESPLATDSDWSQNNAVNILTIHSSKGLEFPVVFITNLVQQRFPTRERKEVIPIPQSLIKEILPAGDFHLQEERRLFYVAMTRARDLLFLTAANFYGEGKRERKLSPFIGEALGKQVMDRYFKKETTTVAYQPSLLEWAEKMESTHTSPPVVMAPKMPITITYLSYSQLQTFDICPLHYKLRYLLKVPVPQTPSQSFGTSVHSALRDFYQSFVKGENVTLDDVSRFVDATWIREGYTSKDHEQDARKRAEGLVKNYLSKNFDPHTARESTMTIELPFQFFIKNGQKSIKLGGRIDRIDSIGDKRIEILDYKTGVNIPDEKKMGDDLQLTFYALAATEVRDPLLQKKPEEVVLSLYYLEKDVKVSTTRTKEQLERAKGVILEKAATMATSDFICSKSIFCHDCEYKMLCNTTH